LKKLLFVVLLLSACSSGDNPEPDVIFTDVVSTKTTSTNLVVSGVFEDGAHSTTGEVKVENVPGGERKLIITNLKSTLNDNKLRIWLSEDLKGTDYELISKTVVNGNSSYRLDANINLSKKKYVLIWCKPAVVLFGSTELKEPS
jgi:hypothetical protein